MKIFFDTEFTGLHKNTTLISLGMVSEDGKTFYAEFTDYDKSQVNDWIKKNVIDNLTIKDEFERCIKGKSTISKGTTYQIKLDLTKWLSQFDYVELVSDCCHYDMVLFVDIFGTAFDLPGNVCPVCYDINQDIAEAFNFSNKEAFDFHRSALVPYEVLKNFNGDKHNSLYDAKVIKACYEAIIKSKGELNKLWHK